MFGLAALAALMAMVFVGASSASAESTALCNIDPGTGAKEACPSGQLVTSVHMVSVGKAKFLASPEVQCNVLFSGTVPFSALASPLEINGKFTYTNCGCTVKDVGVLGSTLIILKQGHETAKVSGRAGLGEVKVTCFGIECEYQFNGGVIGTATGPLLATEVNGEINFSEQEIFGIGFFCPSGTRLDLKMTPLSATYITN
jgi:hypothetical protein